MNHDFTLFSWEIYNRFTTLVILQISVLLQYRNISYNLDVIYFLYSLVKIYEIIL